jgi:hypothetical protein
MKPVTLGLIVGNRGFFPAHLCEKGRAVVLEVLEKNGFNVVALDPKKAKFGSIKNHIDVHKCANPWEKHHDGINRRPVILPNSRDARGMGNAQSWLAFGISPISGMSDQIIPAIIAALATIVVTLIKIRKHKSLGHRHKEQSNRRISTFRGTGKSLEICLSYRSRRGWLSRPFPKKARKSGRCAQRELPPPKT